MRLTDILQLLDRHFDTMVIRGDQKNAPDGNATIDLVGLRALKAAASDLRRIPGIAELAKAVEDDPVLEVNTDRMLVYLGHIADFREHVRLLRQQMDSLRQILRPLVRPSRPHQLDIRLPHIGDMSDLATCIEVLRNLFDLTTKELTGEPAMFDGFDRGSNDISFSVSGTISGNISFEWIVFLAFLLIAHHRRLADVRKLIASIRVHTEESLSAGDRSLEKHLEEQALAKTRADLAGFLVKVETSVESKSKVTNLVEANLEQAVKMIDHGMHPSLPPQSREEYARLPNAMEIPDLDLPPMPDLPLLTTGAPTAVHEAVEVEDGEAANPDGSKPPDTDDAEDDEPEE